MAKGNSWSLSEDKLLTKHYPVKDIEWIASKLSRTEIAVRARAKLLKLKRQKRLTPEIKRQLIKLYSNTLNRDLAKKFKVPETSISHWAFKLRLKKTPEFIRMHSEKGMFKKGQEPANKGKKITEYMSKEAIRKSKKTRFKKGHLPGNTLSDGVITTRKSKKYKKPYKWIRIGVANWKMYHVYLWEKKHGPVADGHIVIFKDGDTMNCKLSNLKMITRQQHAANTRNTDGFIAKTLAGTGRGKFDKGLRDEFLKHPDLLDVKRTQLKLQRQINKK